ncbi:MAG: ParA family protein [Cellvibrionaceae bacterium]|nr:ParA family protein [Cellvibrionaceae bacterium]
MHIWTVANQKGGVGKTTTTVALGGLAAEQGHRVLLVDLDPHGSLSCYFGYDPDTLKDCVFNLFQASEKLDTVAQLVLPTAYHPIALLPASTTMATLERQVTAREGMGLIIAQALSHLEDDFDLVIIDSPPLLGVLLINALAACDRLIIPVQTEFLALKGLERIVHTLDMLRHAKHQALDYVIVPTMFDRRTQASVGSLRQLRHDYGVDTWPGKIPIDTKFRDASKQGIPPSYLAQQTHGVIAYRSLMKWLENSYQHAHKTSSAKSPRWARC